VEVTPGDAVRGTGQVVATNTTPAVAGLFPVASGSTGTATLSRTLNEGQTTTPAQLSAIFGTATPSFSTTSPLAAVACFVGPTPTPSFINLTMNVRFN
jgi:hypothetical protein